MAVGDTLGFLCKRYIVKSGVASFIDETAFLIPYSTTAALSTSDYIIRYGLVTEYYNTFKNICPDCSLLCNLSYFDNSLYPDYPNAAVINYFPNFKPIGTDGTPMTLGDCVLLENLKNNRVLRLQTGVSGDSRRAIVYMSLSDAINDINKLEKMKAKGVSMIESVEVVDKDVHVKTAYGG